MFFKYIIDPSTEEKIERMNERVRWQDNFVTARNIDRGRLFLDDGGTEDREFSFLAIGDTGWGPRETSNPQRRIAEQTLPHLKTCRFLLHTGDVVYVNGAAEYYQRNFIEPYREYLVGGETPDRLAYDRLTFRFPFLAVPGNHDYYDVVPRLRPVVRAGKALLGEANLPRILRNLDPQGSDCGGAYARAFLDCLNELNPEALAAHLELHYSASTPTGRCLRYRAGKFSRLPNRYYTFRYGGIDFFAIDSTPLATPREEEPDWEQMQWLQRELARSWQDSTARGRILYCHHPPYSTEITKWRGADTLAMRDRLRWVFDRVARELGNLPGDRPLLDLCVCGHAHCLEYLEVGNTHRGDANMNWLVCGGSGCSSRSQHPLTQTEWETGPDFQPRPIAKSKLFIGLSGSGADAKHAYSFARIDVSGEENALTIAIRPFVSQWYRGEWYEQELEAILIRT